MTAISIQLAEESLGSLHKQHSDNSNPTSFLSLPTRYEIDVSDKAELITRNTTATNDEELSHQDIKSSAGAGTVLVAKICDALTRYINDNGDCRYNEETVRKVGMLVGKNTLTVESTQLDSINDSTDDLGKEDKMNQTVAAMLNGILDHKVTRTRSVHFNSNEPVLLVNGSSDISLSDLMDAIDAATVQVQQGRGIWPVRVYGGRFWPVQGGGFSISLLNVVNTDIGGPSMVQLLDEHCDAPEWNGFLRHDVWRGRDLVSREERAHWGSGGQQIHDDDDGSEHSMHSEDSTSTHQEDYLDDNAESMAKFQEGSRQSEPEFEPIDQHNIPVAAMAEPATALDILPHEGGETDTPDPAEPEHNISVPQELNVPERTIGYPTWDRRHDSVSLIDLIRSQALDSSPLDLEESGAEAEQDETAREQPLPPESVSKDEDEFVLI
ncbi:hypothetical protein PV10_05263 [Exophiala mesophila]|uniref:DhaK domain-containing protein n=1 Tax=Exophiala mesophila TaxID=212818 RepID=A0A0D2A537_EXOME|nr:uncharacterized protein PV10_05263 [Exophiala mesophila]KIV94108.1 hypothetical protein PV10_05263 [Exophiala mesophila]